MKKILSLCLAMAMVLALAGCGAAGGDQPDPHAGIRPCTGCVHCGYEGPCVQRDGMADLRARLLEADMMALATPLYYYGMSAQLKIAIDRFCAFNGSQQRKHMRAAPGGAARLGRGDRGVRPGGVCAPGPADVHAAADAFCIL